MNLMNLRRILIMSDFEKWISEHRNENVSADSVRESMDRSDAMEKQLMIFIHGLFAKKRKDISETIRVLESMECILKFIKISSPDSAVNDVPDNESIINSGREMISAIDNVVSALQAYSLAHEKFNETVREDIEKKEKFKDTLNNRE